MKKVIIFTETPGEYFRNIIELERQKRIRLDFVDSRAFYLVGLKVYASLPFLRNLLHRKFGKPLHVKNPSWKSITKSFSSYFSLPFSSASIVCFVAPFSWLGLYLWFLKKCGRKVIYMSSWPYWDGVHAVYPLNPVKKFFWKSFLKENRSVGISAMTTAGLISWNARAVQIPHVVDTSLFVPKKRKKNRVLIVGRLIPEKGIKDILDVAQELPDIEFVFAGSGSMEKQIKAAGKNVRYVGNVTDKTELIKLYQSASVFVVNSFRTPVWEELFGVVIVEAFACGIPVIATDCVGPSEILHDGGGVLIAQKDRIALKESILKLCSDDLLASEFAKKARSLAVAKYDVRLLAEKWWSVLEDV